MSPSINNLTKRYYSVKEVALMFDVSPSCVRSWEAKFDTLKPYKSSKGERRFTPDNIRQFETIYQLVREKGYTVKGARKLLHEEKETFRQKKDVLKTLKKLRGFLEDVRQRI